MQLISCQLPTGHNYMQWFAVGRCVAHHSSRMLHHLFTYVCLYAFVTRCWKINARLQCAVTIKHSQTHACQKHLLAHACTDLNRTGVRQGQVYACLRIERCSICVSIQVIWARAGDFHLSNSQQRLSSVAAVVQLTTESRLLAYEPEENRGR